MAATQPKRVEQEKEQVQSQAGKSNATQQQQGLRKTETGITPDHSTAIAGDMNQGPGVWGVCNKTALKAYLENKLFCGFCIFLRYKQEIFSPVFSPLSIPLSETTVCT